MSDEMVLIRRADLEAIRAWPCPQQCENGVIPVQIGDGEWMPTQCQFCDERARILAAARPVVDAGVGTRNVFPMGQPGVTMTNHACVEWDTKYRVLLTEEASDE